MRTTAALPGLKPAKWRRVWITGADARNSVATILTGGLRSVTGKHFGDSIHVRQPWRPYRVGISWPWRGSGDRVRESPFHRQTSPATTMRYRFMEWVMGNPDSDAVISPATGKG